MAVAVVEVGDVGVAVHPGPVLVDVGVAALFEVVVAVVVVFVVVAVLVLVLHGPMGVPVVVGGLQ